VTETIDKLYLELSRVTQARTWKDIALAEAIVVAKEHAHALCVQIEKCGASEDLTKASVMASNLVSELHKLSEASQKSPGAFTQP
jgi:hypothetical protein